MLSNPTPVAALAVDRLGDLRAQIAALQEEANDLEMRFKGQAPFNSVFEGERYRVTVSESVRRITNWKAVAVKAGASRQLIAGNSNDRDVLTLRCVAKLKEVA